MSNVMKSGNLDLLEHSGTIQPRTGIALPFLNIKWPIPIAPRSRVWVCDRSIDGIGGFESRRGHGCLFLVIVVCCKVQVPLVWLITLPEEFHRVWRV